MSKYVFFIVLLLGGVESLTAQEALIDTDSTVVQEPKKQREFKGPLSMFSGNPGRAALYSLILPGAGQVYNKKYWKAPIAFLADASAVAVLIHNTKIYNQWNKALDDLYNNPSEVDLELTKGRTAQEVLDKRDKARQFRDYTIVGVAIVHLVQVADAFVNRHLIEFDVSDDLSLDVNLIQSIPSLGVCYTF